jgi:hypothetical protein
MVRPVVLPAEKLNSLPWQINVAKAEMPQQSVSSTFLCIYLLLCFLPRLRVANARDTRHVTPTVTERNLSVRSKTLLT